MQNRPSRADSTSASPSNAGRPLPAGSAFTLLNAKPLVSFDSARVPEPAPRPRGSGPGSRGSLRYGNRNTRSSDRRGSERCCGIRQTASPGRSSGISSRFRPSLAFFHFLSRRTSVGRPGSPSKKTTLLATLQVRVSVAPATQRRQVRALIRSPIPRSDDVVTDDALGLTTLRAAVAVSLLHRRCLLLPPPLVQRRTG